MKTEQFEGSTERCLIGAMLWDDEAAKSATDIFEKHGAVLRTPAENRILEWVAKYYRTNSKAPKEDTQWILNDFEDSPLYDEVASWVETSPQRNRFSSRFGDILCNHCDAVALERLGRSLVSRASQNNIDGCLEAMGAFKRVSVGVTTGVNLLTDDNVMLEAFNDNSCRSLLKFNDWGEDAQLFFGDTFSRSCFVVFNAPEKGCKSATLLEIAVQALMEGYKVAYFEAGDMSRPQVARRFYQRIGCHPRRAGDIMYPTGDFWVERGGDNGLKIHNDLDKRHFGEDFSYSESRKRVSEWLQKYRVDSEKFRFSDHAQDLTVPQIVNILDEWERQEGFVPDFVLIDYADLLQPTIKAEFRHQVNDIFARLRGLSLDRKCCLVTATQAKGSAYNAETQSRSLIAEDKRKAAHPTAMIGIASVEEEREKQVYHLNYILRRDDVCNENKKLYFAQCLAVCNPMVKCYLPENHHGELHGENKKNSEACDSVCKQLAKYSNDDEFRDEDDYLAEQEDAVRKSNSARKQPIEPVYFQGRGFFADEVDEDISESDFDE